MGVRGIGQRVRCFGPLIRRAQGAGLPKPGVSDPPGSGWAQVVSAFGRLLVAARAGAWGSDCPATSWSREVGFHPPAVPHRPKAGYWTLGEGGQL